MTELLGPAAFFHSPDWGGGEPLVIVNFLPADKQPAQLHFWWRGIFWTAPSSAELAWLECQDEFVVTREVAESLTPELFTCDLAKTSRVYRSKYIDAVIGGKFPPPRLHELLDREELDERADRAVHAFDECLDVVRAGEQDHKNFDEIMELAATRLSSLDMDQRFELAILGRFILDYNFLFPDSAFRASMGGAARLAIYVGLGASITDETS
jgi:hypothetical protein